MNKDYELLTMSNIPHKNDLRCSSVTPSSNPRKEKVEDYETVSIKFKNKEDIINVASDMLIMAQHPSMNNEESMLNLTAYRNRGKNIKGHHVTITLYKKKDKNNIV